jgi:hypothetical protein
MQLCLPIIGGNVGQAPIFIALSSYQAVGTTVPKELPRLKA